MLIDKLIDLKESMKDDMKFIKSILYLIFLIYCLLIFFYDVRLYNSITTFIRVIITFIFTAFSFHIYERTKNKRIIFISIVLSIVGLLDLFSIIFANGNIIINLYSMDISVKIWILGRLIESISFFIASINVFQKFKLKSIFLIYISVLLLCLHIILTTEVLPSLYKEEIGLTNLLVFIKHIVFSLNFFTLSYHIFKTKIIGVKANKFLIFVIVLTIISEIKFKGNIYEKNLLNFIIINAKLVSYFLIFKFISTKLLEYDYREKINNLNKKQILEYALESSLDGIIIIGKNGKIIYSNDSFNQIIGFDKSLKRLEYDEIIENLSKNIKEPENFKKQILESIKTREDKISKINFKNGEVYSIRSFDFVVEGESLGRIISFFKATEKYKVKELKKELEIKEDKIADLKEIDNLRAEFVGNVTHDLRTPITIIMSTIELWNLKYEKSGGFIDYKFTKESFNAIKQNSLRLLKLTNNLIDLTKISRNYTKIKLKNHNIVSLVEDITMSVLNYAKQEEIKLIFDTNTEEKIIGCDSYAIERIMLNLLSNAIKFTPKDGKIEVNIEDKSDLTIISVKDSGRGIPKKKQKSIFDPFEQVDSSDKREKEGSGIGLSLVKFLVEEHGGRIYINDKLEKGTEFIIELPTNLVNEEKNISEHSVDKRRLSIELSDI